MPKLVYIVRAYCVPLMGAGAEAPDREGGGAISGVREDVQANTYVLGRMRARNLHKSAFHAVANARFRANWFGFHVGSACMRPSYVVRGVYYIAYALGSGVGVVCSVLYNSRKRAVEGRKYIVYILGKVCTYGW